MLSLIGRTGKEEVMLAMNIQSSVRGVQHPVLAAVLVICGLIFTALLSGVFFPKKSITELFAVLEVHPCSSSSVPSPLYCPFYVLPGEVIAYFWSGVSNPALVG